MRGATWTQSAPTAGGVTSYVLPSLRLHAVSPVTAVPQTRTRYSPGVARGKLASCANKLTPRANPVTLISYHNGIVVALKLAVATLELAVVTLDWPTTGSPKCSKVTS